MKLQQRFRTKKYNVFTENVNKIELSANDDKRIKSKRFNRNICLWNKQRKKYTEKKKLNVLR